MKLRYGFVTNSSSSSFIIGLKKDADGNYSESTIKAMIAFAEKTLEDVIEEKITTVEELEKRYLEEYYYDTLEDLKEEEEYIYDKFLEAKEVIENGGTIYFGCISDDCYDVFGVYEDLFNQLKKSEDFTGINTELGY